MEDYRSQALRMLARWGEEMERLAVTGQHPLQTIRELPGSKKNPERGKQPNARGTESRRSRPQRVPIRELSGESQRMHKILNFIRDEDEKAYRALELMAYGLKRIEASAALRMNEHEHRASIRVGVALATAILKLRAM